MEESLENIKESIALLVSKKADTKEIIRTMLWSLAKEVDACQGAFYLIVNNGNKRIIRFVEGYAYHLAETQDLEFEFGDGLLGQVALDGKHITLDDVPEGYLTVISGLGKSSPRHLTIFPFVSEGGVFAVVELAAFKPFESNLINYLSEFGKILADVILLKDE
jgi:hypothetical protein